MRNLAWLNRVTAVVIATMVVWTASILAPFFLSSFFSDIGWLELIHSSFGADQQPQLDRAKDSFTRAVAMNPANQSALLGLGISEANSGVGDRALQRWSVLESRSQQLLYLGKKAEARAERERAALFFQGAYTQEAPLRDDGWWHLGANCQRAVGTLSQWHNAARNVCERFFLENDRNLLLNGDFSDSDLSGWRKRYWDGFAGEYRTVGDRDDGLHSAWMHGTQADRVGGIYQEVALPAGTSVRFDAWIKAELDNGGQFRPLHIAWRSPTGQPRGRSVPTVSSNTDWIYYETTFTAPDSRSGTFLFFPALLLGKGEVWVKQVRLRPLDSVDGSNSD